MIKIPQTILLVPVLNQSGFKTISNSVLKKSKEYTLDKPLLRAVASGADLREQDLNPFEVINEYSKGWKFIVANKYGALMQLPEHIATGYIRIGIDEYCALTAKGPIDQQELFWLQDDNALRLVHREVAEDKELKPYLFSGDIVNRQQLTESHIGLFVKGRRGNKLLHSVIGVDTRYPRRNQEDREIPRILEEQAYYYATSSSWEVQQGATLSRAGVQQLVNWQSKPKVFNYGAYSIQEASQLCELVQPEVFAQLAKCYNIPLYIVSAEAPSTLSRANSCEDAWFIEDRVYLPKQVYCHDVADAVFDNTWKSYDSSMLADEENTAFYLRATIRLRPKGAVLKIEASSRHSTLAPKLFKSYSTETTQEASELLRKILTNNNLKLVMAKPVTTGDAQVILPPSQNNERELKAIFYS